MTFTLQVIETKYFFGYWHSLFPSEPVTNSSVCLLNCVLRDPNPRCRMVAMQSTSIILHGSKPFLTRAENSDNAPASYMPFSMALGDMMISMYQTITKAISTESSLPVLTQILKCLMVLIQV